MKKYLEVKEKDSGLSITELNLLLEKWQNRLEMKDWEITISIVDFKRKDYRQSGDFEADLTKKKARILLTAKPFRGDEEQTLVHELVHIMLYDYDKSAEDSVVVKYGKDSPQHDEYFRKLEIAVDKITKVLLKSFNR